MTTTQAPAPAPHKKPWVRRHKILTFFAAVAALIIVIVVAVSAGGGGGTSPSQPAAGSSAGTSAAPTTAAPTHAAGIGTPVRDGKFEFTVTSVTQRKTAGDPQFGGETAQGMFTVLHVTVKNIGSVAQTLNDSAQHVYDVAGHKYDASTLADINMNTGADSVFLNSINPGNTVKGLIAFDMPVSAKAVKAELHDSVFSGGVTVNLS